MLVCCIGETKMRKKTAVDYFWESHRKVADANKTFMDLVLSGLTKEELECLIERRPSVWRRFSRWLDKLPVKDYPLYQEADECILREHSSCQCGECERWKGETNADEKRNRIDV